jgi:hypothetical protein
MQNSPTTPAIPWHTFNPDKIVCLFVCLFIKYMQP